MDLKKKLFKCKVKHDVTAMDCDILSVNNMKQ